jgi:hypothetical protein
MDQPPNDGAHGAHGAHDQPPLSGQPPSPPPARNQRRGALFIALVVALALTGGAIALVVTRSGGATAGTATPDSASGGMRATDWSCTAGSQLPTGTNVVHGTLSNLDNGDLLVTLTFDGPPLLSAPENPRRGDIRLSLDMFLGNGPGDPNPYDIRLNAFSGPAHLSLARIGTGAIDSTNRLSAAHDNARLLVRFNPHTTMPDLPAIEQISLKTDALVERFSQDAHSIGYFKAGDTICPNGLQQNPSPWPIQQSSGSLVPSQREPTPATVARPGGTVAENCVSTLQTLLRSVATGKVPEDQALRQLSDGDGRGRFRQAVQAVTRYQSDGLSEDEAIVQASDSFTYYCGAR